MHDQATDFKLQATIGPKRHFMECANFKPLKMSHAVISFEEAYSLRNFNRPAGAAKHSG